MGAQNTNCTMKFIDIPEDRQRETEGTEKGSLLEVNSTF